MEAACRSTCLLRRSGRSANWPSSGRSHVVRGAVQGRGAPSSLSDAPSYASRVSAASVTHVTPVVSVTCRIAAASGGSDVSASSVAIDAGPPARALLAALGDPKTVPVAGLPVDAATDGSSGDDIDAGPFPVGTCSGDGVRRTAPSNDHCGGRDAGYTDDSHLRSGVSQLACPDRVPRISDRRPTGPAVADYFRPDRARLVPVRCRPAVAGPRVAGPAAA